MSPEFSGRCYLVSKGVPFDIAFDMGQAECLAFVVTMGTIDGGQFDWGVLRWVKKE